LYQFIHDPLLTWRLGARDSPPEPNFPSERRASIIGVPTSPSLTSASTDPFAPASLVTGRARHRSSVAPQPVNEAEAKEVQNARALQVLSRVKEKLTGRDFGNSVGRGDELNVPTQVDRLIKEATNLENLCQHYIGWCSFW
jgi:FKBP12-rapamycin complex-associated protein